MTTQSASSSSGTAITWQRLLRQLPRIGLLSLAIASSYSHAGPREQALQIHNRVAGVLPTEAVLQTMADHIRNNDVAAAVRVAMDNEAFYSVTLKNLATPWTNRDRTVFAPLNDYTATVIGMVRDELDFRSALYDNILYTSSAGGLPAYSNSNNAHYEAIENQGVSLKNTLVRRTQTEVTGLPAAATSGVITTRAAAKAFFYAGTNRAMFRFTLINHLCRDLEQVHDTSLVPDFIRQDVSRSPGGDSRVYLNNCIGCHNGMDPLAKAYAYYDYEYNLETDPEGQNGSIHYNTESTLDPDTNSRVEKKYLINANTFRYGYVTTNDDWKNYWRAGINSHLGWDSSLPGSGSGAKSMNTELAHSQAFASCQVEKVFHNVCLRKPADATDRDKVREITQNFASAGYNLKQVFIDTADYCKGE